MQDNHSTYIKSFLSTKISFLKISFLQNLSTGAHPGQPSRIGAPRPCARGNVVGIAWPCRSPAAGRVATRVTVSQALCCVQAWPCRGLGRDTRPVSSPPLITIHYSVSRYTIVYRDTKSPAAKLPMSLYN